MKHPIPDRASPDRHARIPSSSSPIVEVWGDTVDIRHLGWSVALGVAISLGAFYGANRVLAAYVHDAAMGRAYAMLVGLAGCLIAGVVCAKLFRPKREVVEEASDLASRDAVLDQLAAEAGGLGTVADLPPAVAAEMKELGIYDVFAAYERRAARAPDAGSKADGTVTLAGGKEAF
ncbi:hypothetical protein [Paraburkholderia sp.]|uniref:hypothetical protein n=1 Tax=Paraburkholderia sp. TaxID=1926495 RepID=UPI00238BA8BE|nr:hypothetical protein [Paraburkholderia sp.]MDE1180535.1 hypothetical protein [Paraburkholderia sp.]